jgi:glutamate-1-semialdehyde 2,1-aminomutase
VAAICGYHGWADWYLAANLGESDALRGHLLPGLEPLGVPGDLRGTTIAFRYNSREDFDKIISEHGGRLAAVVMEPARHHDPEPGFLEHIRKETRRVGSLLIFDEIAIGWRLRFGGSHLGFNIEPDMAIFAKALGNGHPIAAVIGTKAAMEGAHRSFISSTNWTESVGPVAALAVINKMEKTRVWERAARVGTRVAEDWRALGGKHRLPLKVDDGYPCLAQFAFTEKPLELKTLYTVLMLEEGFLGNNAIYPTLAHTPDILDLHREAVDKVFARIAAHIKAGDIEAVLGGQVCHSGFKRLN